VSASGDGDQNIVSEVAVDLAKESELGNSAVCAGELTHRHRALGIHRITSAAGRR
jgi:hypothetical protein